MKKKAISLIKEYKELLKKTEKTLGISFRNKLLLLEALTHKSYALSTRNPIKTFNERLEFLGDSVLGIIITEYLFSAYPKRNEGFLTEIRSKLIRGETLALIAKEQALDALLLIGRNEQKIRAQKNTSLMANMLEAIIGAYYLDSNMKKTRKFVLRLFHSLLEKEIEDLPVFEYKNKLQEYTQAKYGKSPDYSIVDSEGPEHEKTFVAEVYIQEELLGKGSGKSKKEAQTRAAKAALDTIKKQRIADRG